MLNPKNNAGKLQSDALINLHILLVSKTNYLAIY